MVLSIGPNNLQSNSKSRKMENITNKSRLIAIVRYLNTTFLHIFYHENPCINKTQAHPYFKTDNEQKN